MFEPFDLTAFSEETGEAAGPVEYADTGAAADEAGPGDTFGKEKATQTQSEGEGTPGGEDAGSAAPDTALSSVSLMLEEKTRRAMVDRVMSGWKTEEAALKALYPAFDLQKELKADGDFRYLLRAGVSMRRAFEAAHLPEIVTLCCRYAAKTAGKKTAEGIAKGHARVQENAVADRAAALAHTDVNTLTAKDILRILDEVGRGAKIKF